MTIQWPEFNGAVPTGRGIAKGLETIVILRGQDQGVPVSGVELGQPLAVSINEKPTLRMVYNRKVTGTIPPKERPRKRVGSPRF